MPASPHPSPARTLWVRPVAPLSAAGLVAATVAAGARPAAVDDAVAAAGLPPLRWRDGVPACAPRDGVGGTAVTAVRHCRRALDGPTGFAAAGAAARAYFLADPRREDSGAILSQAEWDALVFPAVAVAAALADLGWPDVVVVGPCAPPPAEAGAVASVLPLWAWEPGALPLTADAAASLAAVGATQAAAGGEGGPAGGWQVAAVAEVSLTADSPAPV